MGEILSVVKGDDVDIDRLVMDLCEWEFAIKPFHLPSRLLWVLPELAEAAAADHLDGDWATVPPEAPIR